MFILLTIPLILVVFWFWMFWEMSNNDGLPNCYVTFTSGDNVELDWTIAFVFLSILTAGYYFITEYSRQK